MDKQILRKYWQEENKKAMWASENANKLASSSKKKSFSSNLGKYTKTLSV